MGWDHSKSRARNRMRWIGMGWDGVHAGSVIHPTPYEREGEGRGGNVRVTY